MHNAINRWHITLIAIDTWFIDKELQIYFKFTVANVIFASS